MCVLWLLLLQACNSEKEKMTDPITPAVEPTLPTFGANDVLVDSLRFRHYYIEDSLMRDAYPVFDDDFRHLKKMILNEQYPYHTLQIDLIWVD